MSDIKIDLDEQKLLEFEIDIRNDSSVAMDNSEVRFIVEGGACSYQFTAKHERHNNYTVELPPLKSVFKPGEMECFVEVIVNDRIFKPWKETIEFVQTMKVEAKLATKKKPRNVQVKARLKSEDDTITITDRKGKSILELTNEKPRKKRSTMKERVRKSVKNKLRS